MAEHPHHHGHDHTHHSLGAAAVAGVSGREASRLESARGGGSYTADTRAELGRRHPDAVEAVTRVASPEEGQP